MHENSDQGLKNQAPVRFGCHTGRFTEFPGTSRHFPAVPKALPVVLWCFGALYQCNPSLPNSLLSTNSGPTQRY